MKKQNKEQSQELTVIEKTGELIDKILSDTPSLNAKNQNFSDSLKIAKAIGGLRKIFDGKEITELVNSMKDTRVGFLTDRANSPDKPPYDYPIVKEACIEALINGYRLTGNEFNIIAERMYAAKDGKHRRIIEHPAITDFKFTCTPPVYDVETRFEYGKPKQVQFAKVKCFASWKNDGNLCTMGTQDKEAGKEDTAVFKIKVNNRMGDDAIVGKAHSKIFSKVLSRIEGRVTADSDIDDSPGMDIDQPSKKKSIKDRLNGFDVQDAETKKPEPEKTPSQKLADIVADPEYEAAIESLLKSNELTTDDLIKINDDEAEIVIDAIEKVKGFESAEQSNNHEEYFGD